MAKVDRKIAKNIKKSLGIEEEFNIKDLEDNIKEILKLNSTNISALNKVLESDINVDLQKILNGNIKTLTEWEGVLNGHLETLKDERFKDNNIDINVISEVISITQTINGIAVENKTLMSDMIKIVEG